MKRSITTTIITLSLLLGLVLLKKLPTTQASAAPFVPAASGCPVSFAAAQNYGLGTSPRFVVAGDFNGDGKSDVATANRDTNNVSVLLNNGDGTFAAAVNYGVGVDPEGLTTGDFNNDGKLDLAAANANSNFVSILLGNGLGGFTAGTDASVPQPIRIATGDFNGDGKLDLATTRLLNSGIVHILLGNGDGTFAAPQSFAVGNRPQSVTTGDFNADGRLDLAVANAVSANVSVLLGNGDGTFAAAVNYGVGIQPASVTAGDFNADGKLDLAAGNRGGATVSVLLNNGDGTFAAAQNLFVAPSPNSVTTGDFNSDGKSDLATTSSTLTSVLLGNGNGAFAAAQHFATGDSPVSVTAADFNGDGKLDLATANRDGNNVSILLNTTSCTNTEPVAQCMSVTVNAGAACTANASINNGSYDPDSGDSITITQSPAGPYPLGSTLVTLIVTDSNGVESSCQSTVTVVDQTVPDTSLTNTPPAISSANVNFGFTGTDNCAITFECQLDSGAWTPCTSSKSYNGLTNGAHIFRVRAKDTAGNVDPTPATYNWKSFVASCGTTLNPASFTTASLALPFAQSISASPAGIYTFSLFDGTLPPGLQLVNTAGAYTLQGTPTSPGTFTFTFRAQRSNSTCEAIRTYTMTIAPTVVPKVTCKTQNANGSYTVWFGYENTTGAVVTIPVSYDNYFSPWQQNLGQVTTFQVGTVTKAFSVTYANEYSFVGWSVKGPDGIIRMALPTVLSPTCP